MSDQTKLNTKERALSPQKGDRWFSFGTELLITKVTKDSVFITSTYEGKKPIKYKHNLNWFKRCVLLTGLSTFTPAKEGKKK